VYENQDTGTTADRFQVSGAYTMGNNTIKAMYGQNDDDAKPNSTDAYAIGVDHKFSKRTMVYGLYTSSELALRGESSGNNLNAPNTAIQNGSADGFSVGMVHKF